LNLSSLISWFQKFAFKWVNLFTFPRGNSQDKTFQKENASSNISKNGSKSGNGGGGFNFHPCRKMVVIRARAPAELDKCIRARTEVGPLYKLTL
jgi:hypothetical protein